MEDNRSDRFAKIWWKSRADAGISQEALAFELGVSRKTIQNWEKGTTAPSLFQGTEWFRVLGLNPMPYYLAYVFPDEAEGIKASDSDERINEALLSCVTALPEKAKRQLLYLLIGEHGSSSAAVINLLNAYLQLPMLDRYKQAASIASCYEVEEELGRLVCPNNVQPDMKKLNEALELGKKAAVSGKIGYSIAKNEDHKP